MEEKKIITEYLMILSGNDDLKGTANLVRHIFREMDCLKNYLDMASSEAVYVQKNIDALGVETEGKGHAQQALSAAIEGIAAAQEYYDRTELLMTKGIADSVRWFRGGRNSALEKPVSIQAVEQKMESIKTCLRDAFSAVDIGIGRIEEAEGMFCYWNAGSGQLWAESGGDPVLPYVLWAMQSLETMLGGAYDSANETACWTDCLRPKRRAKIPAFHLKAGKFWEKEKVERLKNQRNSEHSAIPFWSGQPKEDGDTEQYIQANKISLRQRLQVAEAEIESTSRSLALQPNKKKGSIGKKTQR